jgi:hypothetical protein
VQRHGLNKPTTFSVAGKQKKTPDSVSSKLTNLRVLLGALWALAFGQAIQTPHELV